jgi:hypothetical protein
VWTLVSDDLALTPPVRYGSMPRGSLVTSEPQAIQVGNYYRVTLYRAKDGSAWEAGSVVFTP